MTPFLGGVEVLETKQTETELDFEVWSLGRSFHLSSPPLTQRDEYNASGCGFGVWGGEERVHVIFPCLLETDGRWGD